LFKKIIISLVIIITLISIPVYLHLKNQQITNPKSDQQQKLDLINQAIQQSFRQTSLIDLYQKKLKFTFKQNQKISTAILSLDKDPYLQITALQKAIKLAKIKNKYIYFVDLSIDHPYATLKNY